MRDHPLTTALIALLLGVFALTLPIVGPAPTAADLYAVGGGLGYAVADGEWWRLFTASWLHAGPVHLAFNVWALWVLGRGVERVYGRWIFIALWFLSALGASLLSAAWQPGVVSVGASGAIFGLFGSQLGLYLRLRNRVPPEVAASMRGSVITSLGINLALGLAVPGIDLAGHVGGLVTGTLFSALVTRPGGRSLRAVVWAVALSGGVLAALGVAVVVQLRGSPELRASVRLQDARSAVGRGDLTEAQAAADDAVALAPERLTAWVVGCVVADQRSDAAGVEERCGRALALDPDEQQALVTRGLSRSRLGDPRAADDLERALDVGDVDPNVLWPVLQGLAPLRPAVVERTCTRLMTASPDAAMWVVGTCAEVTSDPEARLRWRERVAGMTPSGPDDLEMRAVANERLGRTAAAVADRSALLALTPDDPGRLNNLAWSELANGDLGRARDHAVAASASADPSALNTLCMVRLAQRDPGGVDDCRRALALAPDSVIDQATVAWVEGRPEEAEAGWATVDDPLLPQVLARIR